MNNPIRVAHFNLIALYRFDEFLTALKYIISCKSTLIFLIARLTFAIQKNQFSIQFNTIIENSKAG